MTNIHRFFLLLPALLLAKASLEVEFSEQPNNPLPISPPSKPAYSYVTSDYTVTQTGDCFDGTRVWVYAPAVEKPGGADVVIYLHGYALAYPDLLGLVGYAGHIEHLVKQGNYVLFPQFQEFLCELGNGFLEGLLRIFPSSPATWSVRAAETVQDALDNSVLNYNKLFLYGHSLGGALGMMWGNLTSIQTIEAAVLASPQPGGFAAIPGQVTTELFFLFGQDIDVPAAAPHTTFPVAVLHGSDDTIAPLEDVMPSYDVLGSSNKAIYQAQSDTYGSEDLIADHLAALSNPGENTLDWRYFWSGLDQVMSGTPVTNIVFDLGDWSDGQPVQGVLRID